MLKFEVSELWMNQFFGIRPWKRHSLVLLVAGLVYMAIGVSYILAEPTVSREIALQIALNWWSLPKWGTIFVGAGTMSIVSSRWPPISETWGYMVLTGLSAGWAAFYAFGVLFGNSPVSNLSGFLSWGLIGFLWWAISGLVNPDETAHLRAENEALKAEIRSLKLLEG